MGVCLGLQRQQVVLHPSAVKPKCPVISQVPKQSWAPCHKSWNKTKQKIHAGFFVVVVPSLLLSTMAHFGHIFKFLCWKSDEMKFSLFSGSWKSQRHADVLLYYTFNTIPLSNQYMSCTTKKFSTVSPYLQSEAHSKAWENAFPSRSCRAGWVLGWQKGRLSSHCTVYLARHIHFHKNNSSCSHRWADRLVSEREILWE